MVYTPRFRWSLDPAFWTAARTGRRRQHGHRPRTRLRLEPFEARIVPDAVRWTNPAGGDWATPSNWSTGIVPGPADDVLINVPAGVTITHSGGTHAVHSLTSNGTLLLNGGTLDLDAASAVNNPLLLDGGTLTGFGDLTVNDLLIWTAGTMSGPGRTIANAGLAIGSDAPKTLDGRTLDNVATALWTGTGTILAGNGAVIHNLPDATFSAEGDATWSIISGGVAPVFDNAGTLRKSGGTGTTALNLPFQNSGQIEALSGTLRFGDGGTEDGSFYVDAGATLNFTGGIYVLTTQSIVTGPGDVMFTQTGTVLNSMTVLGTYAVDGTTTVSGALVDFEQDVTLNTLLILSNAQLTGSGNVTVTDLLRWSSGTMSGPGQTVSTGDLELSSTLFDHPLLNGRNLDNAGTATLNGSFQALGSVVTNRTGATFTVSGYGGISGDTFVNAGTVRGPTTPNTIATFGLRFDNQGQVEVPAGELRIADGTTSGTFTVAAGATLTIQGNRLTGTSVISGAGTIQLGGSATDPTNESGRVTTTGATIILGSVNFYTNTLSFGGGLEIRYGICSFFVDIRLRSLILSGGLGGPATVTVDGQFDWTAGEMLDHGRTIAAGSLSSSLVSRKDILDRTLEIAGTAVSTGRDLIGMRGDATLLTDPGATFTVQGDFSIGDLGDPYALAQSSFRNAGTFRMTGAAVATMTLQFNNEGTADIQAGTLHLNGHTFVDDGGTGSGTFSVTNGATLTLIGYNLTPTSRVTGAGQVEFNNLPDTVAGAYQLTGNTVIKGDVHFLSSTVNAGTITVQSGTADFAGTATLATLLMQGGSIAGIGVVTVTGLLDWATGAQTGAGRTHVSGTLRLSGTTAKSLTDRTLENAGSATWSGTGTLTLTGQALLDNRPGATFAFANDVTLAVTGSQALFRNSGTLQKTGGTGTTTLGTGFENLGTIDVQAGHVRLTGGTSSGTLTVGAGAVLTFAGHRLTATSQVTGAGTVEWTAAASATTLAAGSVNLTGTSLLAQGTVQFAGAMIRLGTFQITGGTADFAGAATITTLELSGGQLTGLGTVTVTDTLDWSGGNLIGAGRTRSNGRLLVSGTAAKQLNQRTLDNAGTATWSGTSTIGVLAGPVINNLAGAVFLAQGDATLSDFYPSTFNNYGIFRKAGGTGTTSLGQFFNNQGTVDVQTGTLRLENGTSPGIFTVVAGARLVLAGATLTASSQTSGAGTLEFTNRTNDTTPNTVAGTYNVTGSTVVTSNRVNFTGTVRNLGASVTVSGVLITAVNIQVSTLNLQGFLDGAGDITVTDTLNWTGGGMSGPGRTIILGTLTIHNNFSNQMMIDTRILENRGMAAVTGASIIRTSNGALFHNLAGATIQTTSDLSVWDVDNQPCGTFQNDGILRTLAGTGIGLSLQFHNTGTVDIQSGTLDLARSGTSSGRFTLAAGTRLRNYAPQVFTASSSITGAGSVDFSVQNILGSSQVAGTYAVASTAVTQFAGATFLHDATTGTLSLDVSGAIRGPGTLTVTGLFTWTGGGLAGPGRFVVQGGITISGAYEKGLSLDCILDNSGPVTWTGTGGLHLDSGSVFNNLAPATFVMASDASLSSNSVGAPRFNNAGILRKAGSAGTSFISVSLSNTGAVDVQSGTLVLSGGSDQNGIVTVAAGAEVNLAGGAHVLEPDASLSGDGTIVVSAGTVVLSGAYTIGATVVTGGRLDIFSPAAIGSFTNAGAVTVHAGGLLQVSSAYLQTAGATTLLGAGLSADQGVDIEGGLLEGSGTIQADVVNAGQIDVGGPGSAGLLVIDGDYTQTADGILNLELGGPQPGVQSDQLAVTGTATLDGALNIDLLDGFFTSEGDGFQVLTFAARTGDFATINVPDLGDHLRLDPRYSDTDLTLWTVATPGKSLRNEEAGAWLLDR